MAPKTRGLPPSRTYFMIGGTLGGFMTFGSGPYKPLRHGAAGRQHAGTGTACGSKSWAAIRLIAAPIRRHRAIRGCFSLPSWSRSFCCWTTTPTTTRVLRQISDGAEKAGHRAPCSCVRNYFRVGILTDPVLQVGLMIAYVYVVCLLIFFLLRIAIAKAHRLCRAGAIFSGCATRSRASAALPRTGPGCRSRRIRPARLPAGKMGAGLCLAGGQQATLSAAGAAHPARGRQLPS